MADILLKRAVPNPKETITRLQLLSDKFEYPIYQSSYIYLYDAKNDRLCEFACAIDMAEPENMQKLISHYKALLVADDSEEE